MSKLFVLSYAVKLCVGDVVIVSKFDDIIDQFDNEETNVILCNRVPIYCKYDSMITTQPYSSARHERCHRFHVFRTNL